MGLVALKIAKHFNPFLASVPILYFLKMRKILLFSDVFLGDINWEHWPQMC